MKARYSLLNAVRTKTERCSNVFLCTDYLRIHSEYYSHRFALFIMQFVVALGPLAFSASLCVSLLGNILNLSTCVVLESTDCCYRGQCETMMLDGCEWCWMMANSDG